jgi:hypothetical protein
MSIQAIRINEGKVAFGQASGELGPCNLYWSSSVKPNLTGTIDTTAASTTLSGTGTVFTTELTVGGYILTAGGNLLQIAVITNNTTATLIKAATVTETTVTYKKFTTVWLGETGNVVMNDAQEFSPINFIQQGNAAVNMVETSYTATVTCDIGEASASRLTQIFEHIKASRDATDGSLDGYYRRVSIGSAHSDYWDRLSLVKIKAGQDSTDPMERITFLRAAPLANIQVSYDASSQRVVQATFQLYKSQYYIGGSPILWYGGSLAASTITDADGVALVGSIDTAYP